MSKNNRSAKSTSMPKPPSNRGGQASVKLPTPPAPAPVVEEKMVIEPPTPPAPATVPEKTAVEPSVAAAPVVPAASAPVAAPEPPVARAPKGIEVVALRNGFFDESPGSFHRKIEGDKFLVTDKKTGEGDVITAFQRVGRWMKCVDPVMEKKHQARIKRVKDIAAGRVQPRD